MTPDDLRILIQEGEGTTLETFLASLSPQQAQAVRASSDALFWDDVPIWED